MLATERETTLYKELISFPLLAQELSAIREEVYSLPLSSPILSHQNSISRGKKSSGGSRVERHVMLFLASPYVMELEALVRACLDLYEDSVPGDKHTLLALWKRELVGEFPPRLLYRYQYFKEEVALHIAGG